VPRAKPSEVFFPRFLCERSIRFTNQSLYVSLVGAGENCKTLLESNLLKSGMTNASGNDLVKRGFQRLVSWLTISSEFCFSPEIYSSEILEPTRSSARFLSEIRKLPKRTTHVSCYLLSKSDPHFDSFFGEKVVTVTVVIPTLKTVSTIRCHAEISGDLSFGEYELNDIQPLPFVNRIHPLNIRDCLIAKKKGKGLCLSGLDFLKIYSEDIKNIQSSIALENFCEFHSFQSVGGQLGFPCVVGGKVVSVSPHNLTLQSISNSRTTFNFFLSPTLLSQLRKEVTKISSLVGKYVRILIVVWYRCHDHRTMANVPEILLMEQVGTDEEIWKDEIVGFVRLRGKVQTEDLRVRFPEQFLSTTPESISRDKSYFAWRFTHDNEDEIINEFHSETKLIRSLRASRTTVSYPLQLREVFDFSKLSFEALGEKVSEDTDLLHVFLSLLRRKDSKGELSSEFDPRDFDRIDAIISNEKFRWLCSMGFIVENSEKKISICKVGEDVLYFAIRKLSESLLKKEILRRSAASLNELSICADIPPSLCSVILKEMEGKKEVQCLHIQDRRCELFWLRLEAEPAEIETCVANLNMYFSRIMLALNAVSYPLGTRKVMEKLREMNLLDLDHYYLRLVLAELRAQGRIEMSESDMWFYRWDDRLRDILENNKDEAFTLDDLIKRANLPEIRRGDVLDILRSPKQESVATEIFKLTWSYPAKTETETRQKISRFLRKKLASFIIEVLSENTGTIGRARLNNLGRLFLGKEIANARFFPGPPDEIMEETFVYMCSSGQIEMKEDKVELIHSTTPISAA